MPVISLIMATHNYGKYIANALDSCLWQTFKDWELIIVDESSTDETHNIYMSYIAKDSRIKYVIIPRTDDRLMGRLFDAGMAIATGKYIKFFDADDVMYPYCLEIELHTMTHSKNLLAVCGELDIRETEDYVDLQHYMTPVVTCGLEIENPLRAKGDKCGIPDISLTLLPDKYRFERGDLPKDIKTFAYNWRSFIELATHGNLGRIPEHTYMYRQHGDSTSHRHSSEEIDRFKKIIYEFMRENWCKKGVIMPNGTRVYPSPKEIAPQYPKQSPSPPKPPPPPPPKPLIASVPTLPPVKTAGQRHRNRTLRRRR